MSKINEIEVNGTVYSLDTVKQYDLGDIGNKSGDSWTVSVTPSEEVAEAMKDCGILKFNYITSESGNSTIYYLTLPLKGTNARTHKNLFVVEYDGYTYTIVNSSYQTSGGVWQNLSYTISKSKTDNVSSIGGQTGEILLGSGLNMSGNTLSATGGGGGSSNDGFNNLKELTLTPTTYTNGTPSGDFYFEGSGSFQLKDSSSSKSIESIKLQLPVKPGDGVIFEKDSAGNCIIKVEGYKPTIVLETQTASENTSHYGRIYYTFNVDRDIAIAISQGKYNVIIYDQTSGGGYYYCPLQGETMTFLGEEIPNDVSKPTSIVGWSFKLRESETVVSFWRDSLSLNGGGGGGGALYQHTITMQGSQYKYNITVVNSYQGSITSSSIWKEIYGTNRFTVPAIVTDSTEKTASISSVYVYITPTNALSILFFPSNGSSQHSEVISSSASWEDNIISL